MNDTGLPPDVAEGLARFVDAARTAFGADLVSVVLFGSAAEGRMRATSDVNLVVVCSRFDPARLDALREPLRLAHALYRVQAMLLLQSEVPAAAEAFAVKFADIHTRHRVLHGSDPFAALEPSRAATVARLSQVLLTFILRSRERYVRQSLREEQLVPLVADAAAPLRSAAQQILALQGRAAESPKQALRLLAAELDGGPFEAALAGLSQAREQASLPPGTAGPLTLELIQLAQALRARVELMA